MHRFLETRLGRIARFIAFALLVCASRAEAQDSRTLPGHVQGGIANLQPLGRLSQSARLHFSIGLPLRNRDELARLLQQIYDPASPQYHLYLRTEEFTER